MGRSADVHNSCQTLCCHALQALASTAQLYGMLIMQQLVPSTLLRYVLQAGQ